MLKSASEKIRKLFEQPFNKAIDTVAGVFANSDQLSANDMTLLAMVKAVLPSDKEDLPFFANMLGENEYCGISDAEKQYNRYCFSKFNYTSWLMRRKWFSSLR